MPPDKRMAGPTQGPATRQENLNRASTVAEAADHLAHFQRRVLIEAMLDGWGATWERRARALEAARPRPGDFHGIGTTREDLRARWRRLTAEAKACRAHATIAPLQLASETADAVLLEDRLSGVPDRGDHHQVHRGDHHHLRERAS